MKDEESRTPLHYSCASGNRYGAITDEIIKHVVIARAWIILHLPVAAVA